MNPEDVATLSNMGKLMLAGVAVMAVLILITNIFW